MVVTTGAGNVHPETIISRNQIVLHDSPFWRTNRPCAVIPFRNEDSSICISAIECASDVRADVIVTDYYVICTRSPDGNANIIIARNDIAFLQIINAVPICANASRQAARVDLDSMRCISKSRRSQRIQANDVSGKHSSCTTHAAGISSASNINTKPSVAGDDVVIDECVGGCF